MNRIEFIISLCTLSFLKKEKPKPSISKLERPITAESLEDYIQKMVEYEKSK